MLTKQEIHILRQNAKIHKEIFEEIKKILKDWTTAIEVDNLCWKLAKKHWVLCGFKWKSGYASCKTWRRSDRYRDKPFKIEAACELRWGKSVYCNCAVFQRFW